MDSFGFLLFFLIIAAMTLVVVWAQARRGTFVSLCGVLLLLLSPVLTQIVTSLPSSFETWLWTFRALGFCVFIWGLVENVTEALRTTRIESS